MTTHTILLLVADLLDRGRRPFSQEASVIAAELQRGSGRAYFEWKTAWASDALDLLRALREFKPAVVHFSGHGDPAGLWFPATSGVARVVSSTAIAQAFEAAGASVRLIVLSACDSDPAAEALIPHIDCIVSISSALDDEMIRYFMGGFYGALGEHESVAAAYRQGNAAVSLMGFASTERPRLWVRDGVDPALLILAPAPSVVGVSALSQHPIPLPSRAEKVQTPAVKQRQVIALRSRESESPKEADGRLLSGRLRRFGPATSVALAAACVALVASAVSRQQDHDSTTVVAVSSSSNHGMASR